MDFACIKVNIVLHRIKPVYENVNSHGNHGVSFYKNGIMFGFSF